MAQAAVDGFDEVHNTELLIISIGDYAKFNLNNSVYGVFVGGKKDQDGKMEYTITLYEKSMKNKQPENIRNFKGNIKKDLRGDVSSIDLKDEVKE